MFNVGEQLPFLKPGWLDIWILERQSDSPTPPPAEERDPLSGRIPSLGGPQGSQPHTSELPLRVTTQLESKLSQESRHTLSLLLPPPKKHKRLVTVESNSSIHYMERKV